MSGTPHASPAIFLALAVSALAGAAGAAPIGLDEDVCGPLPAPEVVVLPGVEGLPERLVLVDGSREKGLEKVVWSTPEPADGVPTEEFLRSFARVTLWSHADAAALPAVHTPRWATPFGFPTETVREVGDLGKVAVTVHFDAHPDVPAGAHVEPWIEADYVRDGRAYQLLTRGLGLDATLDLAARTRPEATRLERPFNPRLDERAERMVSAVLELTVGEAVEVLYEEGFCVLELRGVDGEPSTAGDAEPVRGVELAGPRHLILVVDTEA